MIFQISSLSSVGGFMVQSMADYSFYNYRVMFLFWVFIGLSALFIRRSSLPESVVVQRETGRDRREAVSLSENSKKTDGEGR